MPDLTSSGVTVNRVWEEGGPSGKDVICKEVTLVLSAHGTTGTDKKIPASALGLRKIEQAIGFRRSDDDTIMVNPSYDGTLLLTYNIKNATDANREDPAETTATIRGVVKGY